ncbi:MAG: hypothetical protein KBD63_04030 [Bacteriovoracaceae bacterium]|nr:hypothetical protein [Bacteriovoracaceae bacterium]
MSAPKNSFLYKIDSSLFRLLDKLKEGPFFIKIQDKISGLDEKTRTLLSYIMTAILFSLPLLICFLFIRTNYALRTDFNLKKEVLETANYIGNISKQISEMEKQILYATPLSTIQAFEAKITEHTGQLQIDASKFKLDNFNSDKLNDIFRSEVKVQFSELSTQELTSLIQNLLGQNPSLRISSTLIRRDNESKLLVGYFKIVNFYKDINIK